MAEVLGRRRGRREMDRATVRNEGTDVRMNNVETRTRRIRTMISDLTRCAHLPGFVSLFHSITHSLSLLFSLSIYRASLREGRVSKAPLRAGGGWNDFSGVPGGLQLLRGCF